MDPKQPDRIDTTTNTTAPSSASISDATATTASPAAMTPASAVPPSVSSSSAANTPASPDAVVAAALSRNLSTTSRASRFSRISQGTRRSRFVEALDDDRDLDLDANYETGSYRGRSSTPSGAENRRGTATSVASLQQRRRSRSSSLGIETARASAMGSGDGAAGAASAAPTSGKRQVSFNFPLPPPDSSSGPDTPSLGTGTPTTPGFYNDRTGGGGGGANNPFSDVYGADTPTGGRSANQSTTSLVRDIDGFDYMAEAERTKGGFGIDSKGMADDDAVPSPRLAYFFEKNPQYGFVPAVHCPARKHFFRTRWVTSSIILISIYATIVSGIFLVIALRGPEWPMIRTNGSLTPSNASLLIAVLAKTVELSFGASVVAFIGQVLSRRSLSVRGSGKGVTLAEMSMRNWIGAPGYMIANFETVRYALFSILGIVSFVAAIVATVYTSASDALVQPQLKLGPLETKIMRADVVTEWANHMYLGYNCESPIPLSEDGRFRNATCLDISYAAQAYHDYQRYLAEWNYRSKNKNQTIGTTTESRVPGYSQFHSEIQVNGTWLHITVSEHNGRVINNVSLAMPHAGVLGAATDDRNNILQPEELGGLGAYTLTASVPSPVIHVLCANMNREELAPIVYTAWNYSEKLDATTWPDQINYLSSSNSTINSTVVDDIFGWGKNGQQAPVFPRYPAAYNTVLNQTFTYGRESIYLLGRDDDPDVERYAVCQLKASLSPNCSTIYNAAQEGSSLSSRCDPEKDSMAYIWSDLNAQSGAATVSPNWPWIGTEWANSLSLNAGIMDGKASLARLLTQSIVREPKLQLDRPSLAEALALLASNTLLMGTQDAQMEMDWGHDGSILLSPETVNFNATLRERTYASGPTGEPQKLFFIVLMLAFLTSLLCLVYFIFQRGLVTDFSEPPNLFSLAVNSPPAAAMAGSCGGGPAGQQWNCEWYIGESGGHLFVVPKEAVPAVVAARGNMGDAWRVEEEASWPAASEEHADHHQHPHHYGQLPQYNNGAGGRGGDLAISTAMVGPATGNRGSWMAKLKQRFSAGGTPYTAGSPDTPSSATSRFGPGGGNNAGFQRLPPPSSAWSNRSFGAGARGAGGYMGLSNPGAGSGSPTSLYPTTTRGTAWTGASGASAYEMSGIGAGAGSNGGRLQPQGGGAAGGISRAYSKLSRKRTYL